LRDEQIVTPPAAERNGSSRRPTTSANRSWQGSASASWSTPPCPASSASLSCRHPRPLGPRRRVCARSGQRLMRRSPRSSTLERSGSGPAELVPAPVCR